MEIEKNEHLYSLVYYMETLNYMNIKGHDSVTWYGCFLLWNVFGSDSDTAGRAPFTKIALSGTDWHSTLSNNLFIFNWHRNMFLSQFLFFIFFILIFIFIFNWHRNIWQDHLKIILRIWTMSHGMKFFTKTSLPKTFPQQIPSN